MRTRTLAVLLIALLSVFQQPAIAQDDPGPEGGDWALQFQVSEDFTLSAFQGSIISVKYHSSDRSAWRAGLGLDFDSSADERQRTSGGLDEPSYITEFSRQAARLDLQYLRYTNPESKVQFLFGGGPFAGFDNRSQERLPDGVSGSREEFDRWEMGVSGLLGVEWFVASRISVHAEYGLEFVYAKSSGSFEDIGSGDTSTGDGESIGFGPRSVLLGVSAYF